MMQPITVCVFLSVAAKHEPSEALGWWNTFSAVKVTLKTALKMMALQH